MARKTPENSLCHLPILCQAAAQSIMGVTLLHIFSGPYNAKVNLEARKLFQRMCQATPIEMNGGHGQYPVKDCLMCSVIFSKER